MNPPLPTPPPFDSVDDFERALLVGFPPHPSADASDGEPTLLERVAARFLAQPLHADGIPEWLAGPDSERKCADEQRAEEQCADAPAKPSVAAGTVREFCTLLSDFRELLANGDLPATPKELRLLIESLEIAAATLSAVQIQAITAFDRATREANAAKGYPASEQGRGVSRAIAMATRTTPHRGARLLATAKALTTEMPHTFVGLRDGRISPYHAQIIVNEGRKLPTSQRRSLFDKRLSGDISEIETLGPRSLRRRAQALVDELHPASAAERFAEESKASCYVDLEELGHGMSRLTATMPTPHAAYIYSVLEASAGNLPAGAHDPATGKNLLPRGQAMAQALFRQFASDTVGAAVGNGCAVDGSAAQGDGGAIADADGVYAAAGDTAIAVGSTRAAGRTTGNLGVVPVTIDLVISDRALLGNGEEPATVLSGGASRNCGPIPAAVARVLIANGLAAQSSEQPLVWLRKLYANDRGALVATSSRQRFHPDGLATMLRLRDQGICRTPWCDAPIRHSDHITPWSQGGATTFDNSAGQCVRCNQSKDAPGWNAQTTAKDVDERHQISYREPTGEEVRSVAPKLPKPAT